MTNSNNDRVTLRYLQETDIEKISHTFTFPWSTFESTIRYWKQCFQEQQQLIRTVCVLENKYGFVGYGSLLRSSEYPHFRASNIPEVNAIWIDDKNRRQGLGKMLIEHLENMARQEGYQTIGIGVGLYQDYGPAQKLYFQLGYSPDGNGITYKCSPVIPGETYPVDDDLIIWLIKPLCL